MKIFFRIVAVIAALAIAFPMVTLARDGEDDPEDTPEVSSSVSPSETPGADDDEDEDEDEQEAETPEPSKTAEPSETPKVSATVRPARTPEIEDEREDEDEDRSGKDEGEDEPEETPEVSVPPELEDDVDEHLSEDDDIRKVEVEGEDGEVRVEYRLRAKLFGLVDVPYELEARVDRDAGEIKVRGPWWLLFARDNAGDVQEALEDAPLSTAKNQGQVLSTILGVLKQLAGAAQ